VGYENSHYTDLAAADHFKQQLIEAISPSDPYSTPVEIAAHTLTAIKGLLKIALIV